MTRPDWAVDLDPSPAGVLRQDITALVRTPGVRRHLQVLVEGVEGIEAPSVDIVSNLVDVDLEMEIVGSQLVAAGELGAYWTGPCRRCLDPIHARVSVDVREIFDTSPVEGETYLLEEEFVDLRPMAREALVLSLPIAPLCEESCAGPAPDAFPAGTADNPVAPDVAAKADGDPRWAALDALSFEEE